MRISSGLWSQPHQRHKRSLPLLIFGRSVWTAERLGTETQISSSLCSVVEVIKQIEPGSVMPTAKPRLQSEVYPPKSCNSNREGGDSVTGYQSSLYMFLTAL